MLTSRYCYILNSVYKIYTSPMTTRLLSLTKQVDESIKVNIRYDMKWKNCKQIKQIVHY